MGHGPSLQYLGNLAHYSLTGVKVQARNILEL